jgi:hypothetical protein
MTPPVPYLTLSTLLPVKCERARVTYHYSLSGGSVGSVRASDADLAKPIEYWGFIRPRPLTLLAPLGERSGAWQERRPIGRAAPRPARNQARDAVDTALGGWRAVERRGRIGATGPGARQVRRSRFEVAAQNRRKVVANHRAIYDQVIDPAVLSFLRANDRCPSGASALAFGAAPTAGGALRPGQKRKAPEGTHRGGEGQNRASLDRAAPLSGTALRFEKFRAEKVFAATTPNHPPRRGAPTPPARGERRSSPPRAPLIEQQTARRIARARSAPFGQVENVSGQGGPIDPWGAKIRARVAPLPPCQGRVRGFENDRHAENQLGRPGVRGRQGDQANAVRHHPAARSDFSRETLHRSPTGQPRR